MYIFSFKRSLIPLNLCICISHWSALTSPGVSGCVSKKLPSSIVIAGVTTSCMRRAYHCRATQRHTSSFQSQKPSINHRILCQPVPGTGHEHIYFLNLFPPLGWRGGVSLEASAPPDPEQKKLLHAKLALSDLVLEPEKHMATVTCIHIWFAAQEKPTAILNWPTCHRFSSKIRIPE